MKKTISRAMIITYALFMVGCASTYKPINPHYLNYNSVDEHDGIVMSYKYDVLREKGNNKYAKKEELKGVKLIAVKITNNTNSAITVGKDMLLFAGQNQIFPMEPTAIKNSIKQIVPAYLPYMLLSFLNLYVTKNGSTETYPIGLALGPGITIGNMATAGSANTKLLAELNANNILDKDIQSGETISGIIGVRDIGFNPLTFKLNK
ncbi:MAG: hypothetical protein ABFS32_14215 [Bacteroidota bacterium]